MIISSQARMMHDQVANWQCNQACVMRDGCYHTERDSISSSKPMQPHFGAFHLLLGYLKSQFGAVMHLDVPA